MLTKNEVKILFKCIKINLCRHHLASACVGVYAVWCAFVEVGCSSLCAGLQNEVVVVLSTLGVNL